MQQDLDWQVTNFCTSKDKRSKKNCPNLGVFMINMFFSSMLDYIGNMKIYLIEEMLARQIYWIEKNNNLIIPMDPKNNTNTNLIPLDLIFNTNKFAFHVFVLYFEFARFFFYELDQKIQLTDKYFGILSKKTIDLFLDRVHKVNCISNFKDFFQAIQYPLRNKLDFLLLLSQCKDVAINKRYIRI